jgi:hypothetical protein
MTTGAEGYEFVALILLHISIAGRKKNGFTEQSTGGKAAEYFYHPQLNLL